MIIFLFLEFLSVFYISNTVTMTIPLKKFTNFDRWQSSWKAFLITNVLQVWTKLGRHFLKSSLISLSGALFASLCNTSYFFHESAYHTSH